jgi:O-antigen/teichoic acid export membrane protein
VISPRIYRSNSAREAWNSVRNVMILTSGLSLVAGILGFFLLEPTIAFLFSERYVAAAPFAKWLWLVICCISPVSLLAPILLNTKKMQYVYVPSVGYPALQALLYLAMGSFGIGGLIAARIVAASSLCGFYALSVLRQVRA